MAEHPRVSICLPNLNQRPFIEERLHSIVSQNFVDWECIAYDNFSDDGSWEVIKQYATRDVRIVARQAPKTGMYANWNNCINDARGSYIYIATSDDTMSLHCLEKMVTALDTHSDCDVCQCGLQMIDREGNPMKGENGGLCWEKLANASYFGDQLKTPHVRQAPHDGLVALAYGTAWTSMTQVLIRRTLFDKVGLFPTNWNAVGDAAWQMKAGLVANVVYIPEKLATWRYYEGQGSGRVHQKALEDGWMHQMGLDALEWFDGINPVLAKKIRRSGILDFFLLPKLYYQTKRLNPASALLFSLFTHPRGVLMLYRNILYRRAGSVLPPKACLVRRAIGTCTLNA
jgi:glycosyltransferase involved in cell wall biosynthesis